MPRIRYLRTRRVAGRTLHYWLPSTQLRALGWAPQRLGDDSAAAAVEAEAINARLDEWSRSKGPEAVRLAARRGTIAWLIAEYRGSDFWRELAQRTRRDYERHLDAIAAWCGDLPIGALSARVIYAYRQKLATLNTPRQSNYRLQVLRLLLQHGVRCGELEHNPAAKFRSFHLERREQVWSDEEIDRFLHVADTPIRLAMQLAVWTGQRQGDVLRMQWAWIDGDWLELRQGKTKKRLSIPIAKPLAEILKAAPRRGLVIVASSTGRPYREDHFRHRWLDTAKRAGIAGKTFLDVRRTAVCRLAEAGCTVPEIAAITGHSVEDTARIIDTYLRPTRAQALAAITKLEQRK